MTYTPFFSSLGQPHASGSSFKTKRKYSDDEAEPATHEQDKAKQMRIRSPPPFHRNTTFPPPDLMTDHSASASDEDQAMDGDLDMGMDMDGDADEDGQGGYGPGNTSPSIRDGQALYSFESGGSGGFGFGPGAEEDEDMAHVDVKSMYPSLTPHPNPNHFSNLPPSAHSNTSPWSAQPYTTSLRPVPSPVRGVIQPTAAAPLAENASEIEKARSVHGPQCKSIPKLVVSPYPDPTTGERSMWSVCQDCGATERAA